MDLRAFDGGYCRQLLGLIDRRTWRWVRFHSVFWAFNHPREGWIVIDTGYGGRFREASIRWPYRLYRYATPATMRGSASEALREGGIDPREVKHVILTHFHADHVGGLAEFPHATVHYRTDAWADLATLSPFKQVRAAFLPTLIPTWLNEHSRTVHKEQFTENAETGLATYDLFGDGSVMLVDLPGHAPGQVGVWWPEARICYAADAFWRESQLVNDAHLSGPALRLQWDPPAYLNTLEKLRSWQRREHVQMLACHSLAAERMSAEATRV